jgi:16S rRNA (adenine1518-N6/adenine1519-N6)-dimethyltransferase
MTESNETHFRAKKSLGQNFLKSEIALKTMVSSADIDNTDTVLEIGPGYGALTKYLLQTAKKVIAVEKDDNLFTWLSDNFKTEIAGGKLQLIHKDVLEFKLSDVGLEKTKYKISANIPYNITGQIIRQFMTETNQPQTMSLLVQKEVAERIVARDGKESILSQSIKIFGDPTFVHKVSRGQFHPQPNVDSAIVVVKNISRDRLAGESEEKFFSVLRAGFSHKRKTLAGNLKTELEIKDADKILAKINLSPDIRAERLQTSDWLNLVKNL